MQTPLSGLDLLIPFIIAIAKQTGLDKRVNVLIAIAVYAIWTAVSLVAGFRDVPHADIAQIAASFPAAFAAALATGYVAYQTIWKQLLNEETLTHATSIIKGPTEDEIVITDEHDDIPPAIVSEPTPADSTAAFASAVAPAPDPTDTDPLTAEDVIEDDGTPQG